MNNAHQSIVPRLRRDVTPPSAPLDPFVTQVVRWIDGYEKRINPTTIAKQAAAAFAWPQPFAEAVLTAIRARRLLTLVEVNNRGGYGVGLSNRGRKWLELADGPAIERN